VTVDGGAGTVHPHDWSSLPFGGRSPPLDGADFGTHTRLTRTRRITKDAPCSPTVRQRTGRRTSGDREGHRPPSPGGPPPLNVPPRAGPWLRRADTGSVTAAAWLAFLVGRWLGVSPEHSVWETIVPETGLDSAPGLVRGTSPGSEVLPGT